MKRILSVIVVIIISNLIQAQSSTSTLIPINPISGAHASGINNTAPHAICKSLTLTAGSNCNANASAIDFNDGSNDAEGDQLTYNIFPAGPYSIGTTNIVFTVTDSKSASNSCSTTIVVIDNTPPIALANNYTVNLNSSGTATITVTQINNGSSDACGIASIVLNKTNFTCINVGSNPVTLTVTDLSGNISTATAVVSVIDTITPIVMVNNSTVQLNSNGNASITTAQINNGSNDACGIATLVLNKSNFTCADIGTNTVTLIATDVNGNTSSAKAIVIVQDNTSPQISGPNDISVFAKNNTCAQTVTWSPVTANDNCSVTLTGSHSSGANFSLGTTMVTYTAIDQSGNKANYSFKVIVVPSPLVGTITKASGASNVLCNGSTNGSATVSAVGGCLPYSYLWNTNPVKTGSIATGLSAGAYNVIVTDANGTAVSLSVSLTQSAPLLNNTTSNASVYFGYSRKSCTTLKAIASGGSPAYTYSWSNGSTSPSIAVCPTVSTVYISKITDANGCVSTSTVKVCVIDVRCERGGNAVICNQGGKVLICHIPNGDVTKKITLCVAEGAVAAHLAHGDQLGKCGTNTNCAFAKSSEEFIEESVITEGEINLLAYPNPFNSFTTIRFSIPKAEKTSIKVYNLMGQEIANVFEGSVLENEAREVTLQAGEWASGVYLCKLVTESGQIKINRLVINK